MAADNEPGDEPWYRTSAAVIAAGVAGLVVIVALVVTVIQMSGDWNQADTTVLTTPATTEQTLRTTEPFVITPSYSSTSFPTSQLSTTEIGLPGEPTSDTDSTTPPTETTPYDPRYPGTRPFSKPSSTAAPTP